MTAEKLIRDLDRINFEIASCEKAIKRIRASRDMADVSLKQEEMRLVRLNEERRQMVNSLHETEEVKA